MPTTWIVNAGAALACVLLLGYGYVLEHVEGLAPCPLCILQRVAFALLLIVLIAAAAHRPQSRGGARAYGIVGGLVSLAGAGIAGWHIHLQNLPPGEAPECGPGLEYMLNTFPLGETIEMIFTGSGECAEVAWSFLSLSIPAWAFAWFVALGAVCLGNNFRTPPGIRSRTFG